VPATASLQQPLLQGWVELHEVVQRPVDKLQARPDGQSVVALQPQRPATQVWPFELAVQSRHWLPDAPHCGVLVPALHTPLKQQPPLHGCDALHAVVQVPVARLHADSAAQSFAVVQPH
jgi:hypothetical protein